jgi:hypothetical protein
MHFTRNFLQVSRVMKAKLYLKMSMTRQKCEDKVDTQQ